MVVIKKLYERTVKNIKFTNKNLMIEMSIDAYFKENMYPGFIKLIYLDIEEYLRQKGS